jgi:hypothetical protein
MRDSVGEILEAGIRALRFVAPGLAILSSGFAGADLMAIDHDGPDTGFIDEVARMRILSGAAGIGISGSAVQLGTHSRRLW